MLLTHALTVAPSLRHLIRPLREPAGSRAWAGSVHDPDRGRLPLGGRLQVPPGARDLLVVLHGLGGSHESAYMIRAARAAADAGIASLRLSMRGADGRAPDIYHAGLTEDVHGALESPDLAGFRRIFVLGYSMGGNLALCLATEPADLRVAAVAGICAPVDLDSCAHHADTRALRVYRWWILAALRRQYARVARETGVPMPLEEVGVDSFRRFDALTVCPRFGFDSPEEYYAAASAAGRLDDLRRPALLVMSRDDPIVFAEACAPHLERPTRLLDVAWVPRGGHIGFPGRTDLGLGPAPGLEAQTLSWLLSH